MIDTAPPCDALPALRESKSMLKQTSLRWPDELINSRLQSFDNSSPSSIPMAPKRVISSSPSALSPIGQLPTSTRETPPPARKVTLYWSEDELLRSPLETQSVKRFACLICFGYMFEPIFLCVGGQSVCSFCHEKTPQSPFAWVPGQESVIALSKPWRAPKHIRDGIATWVVPSLLNLLRGRRMSYDVILLRPHHRPPHQFVHCRCLPCNRISLRRDSFFPV